MIKKDNATYGHKRRLLLYFTNVLKEFNRLVRNKYPDMKKTHAFLESQNHLIVFYYIGFIWNM